MRSLPFSFKYLDVKQQKHFVMQHYTIWMVLQGTLNISSDSIYTLSKNDIIFFDPDVCVAVTPPYASSVLEFTMDSEQFCKNIGAAHPIIVCNSASIPGEYDNLISCITKFSEAYFNCTDITWAKLMSNYYALIYLLQDFMIQPHNVGVPSKPSDSTSLIHDLERYIHAHYMEPLSLNSLSVQFYLSPTYLSKYFTKNFGINFHTYLQNIRLGNTLHDILTKDIPIAKAAHSNGFSSISSFNIAFKKEYGMPPTKYIKNHINILPNIDKSLSPAPSDGNIPVSNLSSGDQGNLRPQAAPDTIEYTGMTDLRSPVKIQRSWERIINLGNAVYCLNSEFQKQLTEAQKHLHFENARIDGIIEMLLYSEAAKANVEKPNFYHFNRVINFLLSAGIKPFFELGRRPSKTNVTHEGFNYSINKYNNIDEDKWEILIHKLLVHCVNYWGINEVSKWHFEMWVQPSTMPAESSLQNYVHYFEITQRVIKSIAPAAKFGGPGINLGGLLVLKDMEQSLQIMQSRNLHPDFISAYLYPSCDIERTYEGTGQHFNIKMLIKSDESTNINKLKSLSYIIEKYFQDIPVYLTEFTSAAISRVAINETCYTSSYIVKTAIDLHDKVNAIGYWQFSDITHEHEDASKIIFGGNGLISRDGIQKCGYFAFQFLSKLGDIMMDRGKNHMTTKNSDNEYSIIVHNYKNLSDVYCTEYFKKDEKVSSDNIFENMKPLHFRYAINDIQPGKYVIKKYILNSHHGNLADIVAELNCWEYACSEELEYLARLCVPQEQILCMECENSLEIEATLEPLEVVLFSIVKSLN